MKKLSILLVAAIMAFSSFISVSAWYVSGYYRSNGTYVNWYYRSNANAYKFDNYSYKPSQGLYNSSYYSRSYSSPSWYTPSYKTQSNYYQWLNSYKSKSLRSY